MSVLTPRGSGDMLQERGDRKVGSEEGRDTVEMLSRHATVVALMNSL